MEQETKRVLFLIERERERESGEAGGRRQEAGVESWSAWRQRDGAGTCLSVLASLARQSQGRGGEGRRGGETPTELLLYVNIYFRRSYLAGDGRWEAELR